MTEEQTMREKRQRWGEQEYRRLLGVGLPSARAAATVRERWPEFDLGLVRTGPTQASAEYLARRTELIEELAALRDEARSVDLLNGVTRLLHRNGYHAGQLSYYGLLPLDVHACLGDLAPPSEIEAAVAKAHTFLGAANDYVYQRSHAEDRAALAADFPEFDERSLSAAYNWACQSLR